MLQVGIFFIFGLVTTAKTFDSEFAQDCLADICNPSLQLIPAAHPCSSSLQLCCGACCGALLRGEGVWLRYLPDSAKLCQIPGVPKQMHRIVL